MQINKKKNKKLQKISYFLLYKNLSTFTEEKTLQK